MSGPQQGSELSDRTRGPWVAVAVGALVVAWCVGIGWVVALNRGRSLLEERRRASYMHLGSGYTISWSPDCKRIAHEIIGPHGDLDVCVSDAPTLAAGGVGPLTETIQPIANTRADEQLPAWSPDGKWIAFVRSTAERRSLCVVAAPPGTGPVAPPQPAFTAPAAVVGARPHWSPDSSMIALSYWDPGSGEPVVGIVFAPTGRDAQWRLTRVAGASRQMAGVSVDYVACGWLVFQQDHPGGIGLDLVEIGTGAIRRLTSGPADMGPTASPDGAWIAYTSSFDGPAGPAGPYVVSTAGGDPVPITGAATNWGKPSWSPDSRRLAIFGYDPTSNWSLHIATPGEGQWVAAPALVPSLSQHGAVPDSDSWSPDGKLMALTVLGATLGDVRFRIVEAPKGP